MIASMCPFLEGYREETAQDFVCCPLSTWQSGSWQYGQRDDGVIELFAQIGKLKLKFLLGYGAAERLMVTEELVATEEF